MKKKFILLIPFIAFCMFLLNGCKRKGCTIPCAINYDSKASKDDGSCEYSVPSGAVTSTIKAGGVIDFETGKTDSLPYPCLIAHYDDDVRLELFALQNSNGTSTMCLNFNLFFPHKAKGDTTCIGPTYDNGGGCAISFRSQTDESWNTCSIPVDNFRINTSAIAVKDFFVVKTRVWNYYKIYVDAILLNGTTPDAVIITWAPMH